MNQYKLPLPQPNLDDQAFWDGCKRHELLLVKCTSCGAVRFYPRPTCPHCLSAASEHIKASGKGELWSYTTSHHAFGVVWREVTPYTVIVVELEEGPRMVSNIIGCDPSKLFIGMPLEIAFHDVTPEITLPKFRPAGQKKGE